MFLGPLVKNALFVHVIHNGTDLGVETWVLVPTSAVRCWGLDYLRLLCED